MGANELGAWWLFWGSQLGPAVSHVSDRLVGKVVSEWMRLWEADSMPCQYSHTYTEYSYSQYCINGAMINCIAAPKWHWRRRN